MTQLHALYHFRVKHTNRLKVKGWGKAIVCKVGILISETKKTNSKIIQETKKDVMYL